MTIQIQSSEFAVTLFAECDTFCSCNMLRDYVRFLYINDYSSFMCSQSKCFIIKYDEKYNS